MDDRVEVLANSLFIESFISHFLCFLLGIKEPERSKSFSGKSTSLSHFQKVNLLIDVGALKSEELKIFDYYLQVRNMFMHNFSAYTYNKCYELLPEGTRNGIKNLYYPEKGKKGILSPSEIKLAIKQLGNDALNLTKALIEKLKDKAVKDAEIELNEKFRIAVFETINEITNRLNVYFDGMMDKGEDIEPKTFEHFGTNLNKEIIKSISKKMSWHKK